ncbi:MAG: mechanosensitive ion channel family protein [Bacteroidales bacterium]|jgi:MscS family membrane protein|nr:mechanosensitive ion channel family protein [Bacteroidales bacterium]
MLEKVYYGNTLQDWGISLLIIIGALLLNKGISMLNKHVIRKVTAKSKNKLDDILFSTLEKPILLGIILVAIWIAATRLDISVKVRDVIGKSYQILTVLNITWFFALLIGALIDEYSFKKDEKTGKKQENKLLPLIKRGILILVWTIGLVTALNNVGVKVTTLLGTLGIGGVAVALAAQDTIKNIFGGITIFTDHPFHIGDTIRFDSYEGTVEDIGIRSTRVRTYDKQIVTVPNYRIMDASVTNISVEPKRRIVVKLGVTYDTSPAKMKEAINILTGLPKAIEEMDDKDLTAIFSDFADSALIITYTYFIKKSADILGTTSKVNFEILSRFNAAGLNFAFPTQTITISEQLLGKIEEKDPDKGMETSAKTSEQANTKDQ